MKSPSLDSMHPPSADAPRTVGPNSRRFDDSLHPVWAIANKIAICFLATSAVAFLALMTDAILTRT